MKLNFRKQNEWGVAALSTSLGKELSDRISSLETSMGDIEIALDAILGEES